MLKPFRPPSFVRPSDQVQKDASDEPPLKRRRIDHAALQLATASTSRVAKPQAVSQSEEAARPVLSRISDNAGQDTVPASLTESSYYNVLWRKPTAKKHKTWDSDGILRIAGGFASLQDILGKEIGKTPYSGGPLLPESNLKIGGRDVEVESVLSQKDYLAGRPFLTGTASTQPLVIVDDESPSTSKSSVRVPNSKFVAPVALPTSASKTSAWKRPRTLQNPSLATESDISSRPLNVAATQSLASRGKWKNPVKENTVLQKVNGTEPTPRHDATAPDALIMKRPSTKDIPKGKQVVDVVVDPLISKKLRDHQRQGVKFLYDCVMGLQTGVGQGAILADEMGLGKTLQTIALIWTLLKQNPIYEAEPVIRKALIVCPVTLIKNWRKEFRKWLGPERLGVFIADDKKTRITHFTRGKSYSVMIIGYERLRSVHEELQKGHGIDLVVADEGHRLKTAQSKSAQAIQSLSTARRIILSGTPIQNDLSEFFSMVDFVNPGALGPAKSFVRNFEKPIERSRQPDATEKEVEQGNARGEELAETTNVFILRRTADILAKYLPPKTESVLVCRPTGAQVAVYKHVLGSPVFQSALGSSESALQLITILKKVCNSPQLLSTEPGKDPEKISLAPAIAASIPAHLLRNASASAKLRVLDQLLSTIQRTTTEKVVIVSNFTSTLDLLEQLLTSLSMGFLRLDGSTPTSKRQDLVDTFNHSDSKRHFAILLSAKAGGMGLNLIGASRLVLFDVDWNPAIDAQAMARIHRDGQKLPCHIYRLILGGALDEKIWQRQVTKLGLANSVLESKSGQASFSRDELKDLFRLDEGLRCQTHELIRCQCGGRPKKNPFSEPTPDLESGTSNDSPMEISSGTDSSESDQEIGSNSRHRRKQAAIEGPPHLIKSSELDIELQERIIRERREAARTGRLDSGQEMASLMAYDHIDTKIFSGPEEAANHTETTSDDILDEVVRDEDNLITFVFTKTTS